MHIIVMSQSDTPTRRGEQSCEFPGFRPVPDIGSGSAPGSLVAKTQPRTDSRGCPGQAALSVSDFSPAADALHRSAHECFGLSLPGFKAGDDDPAQKCAQVPDFRVTHGRAISRGSQGFIKNTRQHRELFRIAGAIWLGHVALSGVRAGVQVMSLDP